MTALSKFERLESLGLWKETTDAQRVEVIVSFGDNSLVFRDTNDRPLTHWSLAAVERLNPKEQPAIYAVGQDASETLEIDDKTMINAIERIRARLLRARPKPGRLRVLIALCAFFGFFAFMYLWLPNATARYASRIIPDAKVAEIGTRAMVQMERLTGRACSSSFGNYALRQLEDRLIGAPSNQIVIANLGERKSALLPGGTILINKTLLLDQDGPELMAGYVLKQRAIQDETAPMMRLFQFAGVKETLRFLANGTIKEDILDAFSENQLTQNQPLPDMDNLADLFDVAELQRAAFARDDDAFKELLDNDPYADTYVALLSDEDWLSLQEICD